MSLERIFDLAQEVGPVVEEITQREYNWENLEFIPMDFNALEWAASPFLTQAQRVKDHKTWHDSLAMLHPRSVFKIAEGIGTAVSAISLTRMLYIDHGTIAVRKSVLDFPDKVIRDYLAHELVHPLDQKHFDINKKRYKGARSLVEAQIDELVVRHTQGFFRGYVIPSSSVRDAKKNTTSRLEDLGRLMTIIESHAEYVREQYRIMRPQLWAKEKSSLGRMATKALLMPFLLMSPSARNKIKQYKVGKDIVREAYNTSVSMDTLYDNIPSKEEFKSPERYFHR